MLLIYAPQVRAILQSARVQGRMLLTFFSARCFLYCIRIFVSTSLHQECRASIECTNRWLL